MTLIINYYSFGEVRHCHNVSKVVVLFIITLCRSVPYELDIWKRNGNEKARNTNLWSWLPIYIAVLLQISMHLNNCFPHCQFIFAACWVTYVSLLVCSLFLFIDTCVWVVYMCYKRLDYVFKIHKSFFLGFNNKHYWKGMPITWSFEEEEDLHFRVLQLFATMLWFLN